MICCSYEQQHIIHKKCDAKKFSSRSFYNVSYSFCIFTIIVTNVGSAFNSPISITFHCLFLSGWIILLFLATTLLTPLSDNHYPYQLQRIIYILCKCPAPSHQRGVYGRKMGEWTDSVFCMTHTVLMPWHILLAWFFRFTHQFPPWYVILFHHTLFINPYHQLAHHIRLLWAIPGWFVSYVWVVIFVNLKWKSLYRPAESFLAKHTPIICDYLFDLFLKVNGMSL